MKTLFCLALCVAILGAVLFFFVPWAKEYAVQGQEETNNMFAEKVSNDHLVSMRGEEIEKAKIDARDQMVGIIQSKKSLTEYRDQLDQKSKSLEKKKAALKQAAAWLKSHKAGDIYEQDGKKHSYADMESYSRSTLAMATADQELLKTLGQSCQSLETTIGNAQKAYDANLVRIAKYQGDLDCNALKLEAQAIANQVRPGSSRQIDSLGNSKAQRQIEKRLNEAEADARQDNQSSVLEDVILANSENVVKDIEDFVGEKPEQATQAVANNAVSTVVPIAQ